MSSNFSIYHQAASRIQQGWTRGTFEDVDGNICMVQGVLDALGLKDTKTLPPQMVAELDSYLMESSRSYPYIRYATLRHNRPVQEAIEYWNDMPWRRKRTVVAALGQLSTALLLDEVSRLRIEVIQLRKQNEVLQQRVEQLQQENRHLRKRLANYLNLKTAKRKQAEAQTKVDEVEHELQQLLADESLVTRPS